MKYRISRIGCGLAFRSLCRLPEMSRARRPLAGPPGKSLISTLDSPPSRVSSNATQPVSPSERGAALSQRSARLTLRAHRKPRLLRALSGALLDTARWSPLRTGLAHRVLQAVSKLVGYRSGSQRCANPQRPNELCPKSTRMGGSARTRAIRIAAHDLTFAMFYHA